MSTAGQHSVRTTRGSEFIRTFRDRPGTQFASDIWIMIRQYPWYSVAILAITVLQEITALWPVNALGHFIDGLQSDDITSSFLLLIGTSVLAPGVARLNVIVRHKMFYHTDFQSRVEMTFRVPPGSADVETAGKVNSRIANAVGSITNAAYHVLGSFTPVIIKVVVVSGSLLAYNRMLGWVFVASLTVPVAMTITYNVWQRRLRDHQYSAVSRAEGIGTRLISAPDHGGAKTRFLRLMRERRDILFAIVARSQTALYAREVGLLASQFAVVAIALSMRHELALTAGDFTRVIGYTAQVSIAFINAAACLDAVVSYSRAWHVYDEARRKR
jgi:ABC-type multidrug transport system fused ATPase/permease subunit